MYMTAEGRYQEHLNTATEDLVVGHYIIAFSKH